MKKLSMMIVIGALGASLFAGIASAHVTVSPKETTQGAYEVFTVRVPTEKPIPTTKVEVKFPADVSVSRFEPKDGWKYDIQKDASGKITGVTWTAAGEGLSATEFGDFKMQGKVGDQAKQIVWKAYQTYKDGSVVEWVGAEGSDKPASVTVVKEKAGNAPADSHGDTSPATGQHDTAPQAASSSLPLYLSIAALAAGLLALIVSLRRK